MGLEVEELIMACEEGFRIDFRGHEEELSGIETVGDLHRCILTHIEHGEAKGCANVPVLFSLRRALTTNFSVEKSTVQLDTTLQHLSPADVWYAKWGQLQHAMPYDLPTPRAERPAKFFAVVSILLALFTSLLVGMTAVMALRPSSGVLPWWYLLPVVVPLLFLMGATLVAAWRTRGRIDYTLPGKTIGDLVRRTVVLNTRGIGPNGKPWNEESVWDELRNIVAERFDVDKGRIGPETDFFKDLGAG